MVFPHCVKKFEKISMLILLEYFEDTYICRFHQNIAFRDASISINRWNMFDRTDQKLSRTNNSFKEASLVSRTVSSKLSRTSFPLSPELLEVGQRLKKNLNFAYVRISILQHQGGHLVQPPRRRYADCNSKILRIASDYLNDKFWITFGVLHITYIARAGATRWTQDSRIPPVMFDP